MIQRTKIVNVHHTSVLILSLVPIGIDVALATFGIHESTTTTRVITGLIFGLALSIVLVPVLEEFADKLLSYVRTLSNTLHHRNLRNQPSALNLRNPSNLQSAFNPRNLSNQSRTSHATETR
jgi:hypothetical protein